MAKSSNKKANEDVKPSDLRLLILSPQTDLTNDAVSNTKELFTDFLTHVTSSAPSSDLTTFAGYTSHPPLEIRNNYYNANVNLWCDELVESTDEAHDWATTMCSDEANEVRQVIGGIVLLLPYTSQSNLEFDTAHIKSIIRVRDMIDDESGRDLASIVLLQDLTPAAELARSESGIASYVQKLEEACLEKLGIFGLDVVSWRLHANDTDETSERNEYGELTGIPRVVEILEQINWAATNDGDEYGLVSVDDVSDDDFETPGYKPNILGGNGLKGQSDEFQREIMGLHFALEDQSNARTDDYGDDSQVEQLAGLMERVTAMREAGAEMGKEEREKFARREVGKIMRDLNI